MKVLVIGGTAFLGVWLCEALEARAHDVVLFNRGKTASPRPDRRTVIGDRTIGFNALSSEHFDAVVDTSGYLPHVLELSAQFFEPRTSRYAFISSVSVFDAATERIDESSPIEAMPPGASLTSVTSETYGPLKGLCEEVVTRTFSQRATIVRPGLIVGPHDPTDRFTYWPMRFARGGRILAPGTPEDDVQFIDVRDLAEFVAGLLERREAGDFNVTSPPGLVSMGEVMATCGNVAGVASEVVWADDEFLLAQGVEPWVDLPLWIPPSMGMPGFMNVDASKAMNAGLTHRPLCDTVRDTMLWAREHRSGDALKAGLSAEREAAILAKLGEA